jgi:hypothetical protein
LIILTAAFGCLFIYDYVDIPVLDVLNFNSDKVIIYVGLLLYLILSYIQWLRSSNVYNSNERLRLRCNREYIVANANQDGAKIASLANLAPTTSTTSVNINHDDLRAKDSIIEELIHETAYQRQQIESLSASQVSLLQKLSSIESSINSATTLTEKSNDFKMKTMNKVHPVKAETRGDFQLSRKLPSINTDSLSNYEYELLMSHKKYYNANNDDANDGDVIRHPIIDDQLKILMSSELRIIKQLISSKSNQIHPAMPPAHVDISMKPVTESHTHSSMNNSKSIEVISTENEVMSNNLKSCDDVRDAETTEMKNYGIFPDLKVTTLAPRVNVVLLSDVSGSDGDDDAMTDLSS